MPEESSGEPNQAVPAAGSYPPGEGAILRRAASVEQFPLFANISGADCGEIVSRARERQFSRHQTIFMEGDPVRDIILLISGSAKITQLGQNASTVILRIVGPGEIVDVVGLSEHCSTAQALSDSTALVWDTNAFEGLAALYPAFSWNMVKLVSRHLTELEERYREVSTEKVAARLSHQLTRLLQQVGPQPDGTLEINLSREELAQLTGTTSFAVGRLLSEWEQRGVVSTRRGTVSVQDVETLREVSESE